MRSVLVVHPHRARAEAIGMAIDHHPELTLAGTVRRPESDLDAEPTLHERHPDVAVIDGTSALDVEAVVATVRAAFPAVHLIVLAEQVDPVMLRRAAQAGVQGFVSDKDSLGDLLDAIRAAGTELLVVPVGTFFELVSTDEGDASGVDGADRAVQRIVAAADGLNGPASDGADEEHEAAGRRATELEYAFERAGLTRRERDVLERLALGRDPQGIARDLFMSVHTARGHLKSIMMKLGAHTQLEVVVEAARAGLLPQFPSATDGGPSETTVAR